MRGDKYLVLRSYHVGDDTCFALQATFSGFYAFLVDYHVTPGVLSLFISRRIKEFYRWPGDIGELPIYLKHAMYSKDSDLNSSSTQSERIEDEMKAAAQHIASYQVVLSRDGKIVEFQRTNRGAENQRAASPLVKELYGKKKHSHYLFH
ncbi:hypothetical protein CQW23_21160 [Capsicum baccatum]|uniref:Uncharacterized protein n=1 Tax=Capsicum baccatum TaxID=33114 RepID=A0A2G2VX78_CAPBA|nr:hypothetical protein CQW23_21160 [Capsicum baccatum]